MTNFGGWGLPGGGFNWGMLTNIGAGMLANSQYAPATAFGKGYQGAVDQSLDQAKAQLMFQEYDRKQKADELAQQYGQSLQNALSEAQQPPPTAGGTLSSGFPQQFPNTASALGITQSAPAQAQVLQGFDQAKYDKLGQIATQAELHNVPHVAQAARMQMQMMTQGRTAGIQQQQLDLDQQKFGFEQNKFTTEQGWKGKELDQKEREFFDKTQTAPARERLKGINESDMNARSSKSKLGLMRKYAADKNFYSGFWGENVALPFKRALASAGIAGAESVGSMEAFHSLSKQGIIDGANGSLGNQISKSDTDIIGATVPGLSNTEGGNKQIIDILEKIADRKIEYAKQANAYFTKNKSLEGFDQQFAEWADKHSLFEGMTPTGGVQGGGDTTPRDTNAPKRGRWTPGGAIQWQ